MKTLLDRTQRAIVREATGIDPFIVDRVTSAYDCLVAGDKLGYQQNLLDAYAQQNLPWPIPANERPTAIDRMKRYLIQTIASERHWPYDRARKWLADAAKEES